MPDKTEKKCVVLGVTGGIAAYKACEILRLLQKQGMDVFVVMTKNATRFVAPLTFETLSGHPVAVDTFERPATWEVEHIALAKRADLFLIAPATANIIAKLACGIADDMLSTTVLATRAPVMIAPAMNTGMWENPATQDNLRTLMARGVRVVAPASGHLACGDSGAGKLEDVEVIVRQAVQVLQGSQRRDMEGLRVMVTAGPTREPLDPVRYISNRSSGKMGYAIARAAARRGAQVTLLSGPVSLPKPEGVEVVPILTTQELLERAGERVDAQDVLIQAAAPADYRAKEIAPQKIKKQGGAGMTLELVENPDVAAALGQRKQPHQVFVGFAAETNDVQAHARDKLARKNLDMIVANDVTRPGAGFDVDTNIVTLMTGEGSIALELMTKDEVAQRILDRVLELRGERTGSTES
ncbi:MAG: bifunctional phosphopantothenoylcysteine decarboxylase/phosphopantothenate--cysteine ligase CoaBC [Clostridiales bacterium]|nr:bifunctional phosphopantothenoylcysteine decarboxylase/phosphopantothenate--cysteine ligase CoaBC [Clostridiales bacterium]MDY5513964.1 bifunctional phosphopantothenoylcysteine decarboxylase/phosphopantothenate--cysteine ligase CoaBC [Candidatus Ventricola sp.]